LSESIPNEIIAVCAMNATLETTGVCDMATGLTDSLSKSILGRERLAKGIRISEERDGLCVDVYIHVCYNANIPIVAWDVQNNVMDKLETIADVPVLKVNIHVQGVGFEQKKEEQVSRAAK